MLVKTPGIAIKNTKYGETSVISKIYTRQFGMQSFIINGIHAAKAAIKPSQLQSLVLLDLVIYNNHTKKLQRIKELKSQPVLANLHFDVIKSSIGMYMAELIYKTIKEEEPNEALYDFLEEMVLKLDTAKGKLSFLPLVFTIRLSGLLGFYPQNNFSNERKIFSLQDGRFKEFPDKNEEIIEAPYTEYLSGLLQENPTQPIPRQARTYLLNRLMDYYNAHIPSFQEIKSLSVLHSVLE